MTWLNEADVPVLDWVGQSCDLNPIENCWHRLKRIIATYPAATNLEELATTIKKAWRKLAKDMDYLKALTNSMSSRVNAVLEANGDVTKY